MATVAAAATTVSAATATVAAITGAATVAAITGAAFFHCSNSILLESFRSALALPVTSSKSDMRFIILLVAVFV